MKAVEVEKTYETVQSCYTALIISTHAYCNHLKSMVWHLNCFIICTSKARTINKRLTTIKTQCYGNNDCSTLLCDPDIWNLTCLSLSDSLIQHLSKQDRSHTQLSVNKQKLLVMEGFCFHWNCSVSMVLPSSLCQYTMHEEKKKLMAN